jgi:hypothetical protein
MTSRYIEIFKKSCFSFLISCLEGWWNGSSSIGIRLGSQISVPHIHSTEKKKKKKRNLIKTTTLKRNKQKKPYYLLGTFVEKSFIL